MADFLQMSYEFISKIIDEDFLENLLADKNQLENEKLRMELKKTQKELVKTKMDLANLKIDNEGRIKMIRLLAESEAEYRQQCESQLESLESLTAKNADLLAEVENVQIENNLKKLVPKKVPFSSVHFDFGNEKDIIEGDAPLLIYSSDEEGNQKLKEKVQKKEEDLVPFDFGEEEEISEDDALETTYSFEEEDEDGYEDEEEEYNDCDEYVLC